jgi:LAS superfamily LD-carboxypeptidase LdcB
MNELELTGRARTHLAELADPKCTLHRDAVASYLAMRAAAAADGIDLVPVSSFRDFDAQVRIWNDKFHGRRALHARDGTELKAADLAPEALVDAILCWSAVPGASRHHWGSEIDVVDGNALAPGTRVQLLPEEFTRGPFARLNRWLDTHLSRFGFFRPYTVDRGGVAPEPWHVSFAPVSVRALALLTPDLLHRALRDSAVEGKDVLLARLAEIHGRYVAAVDEPAPRSFV